MTNDERQLLIYVASSVAESLSESSAKRGTTNNLADEMRKLIDKIEDDQDKVTPSISSTKDYKILALELSFQTLLKNVALSGSQRMANNAKREAIAAAKKLDSGDLLLPAQVELLYAGVKSDRMDGT
jgi:hypothetical protein